MVSESVGWGFWIRPLAVLGCVGVMTSLPVESQLRLHMVAVDPKMLVLIVLKVNGTADTQLAPACQKPESIAEQGP
jgi:hypothetical protein